MALVLADRVQQTGTANTTVSFTLSGSVTGFQSFSVIGNTNTTYYAATDASGNWEVGIGTYSTTGPTLTRTTILSSSNSGSAETFSGTVTVFVTYPSSKSVEYEQAGGVVITDAGTNDALRITQTGTGNALVIEDAANPDSTPFVVDASGRVIEGTTQSYATVAATSVATPQVQQHGVGSTTTAVTGLYAWNGANPYYLFSKAGTGGIGTYAAATGSLGIIQFNGADGTNFVGAASIVGATDGTFATDDAPGRIVFNTRPAGAGAALTERMRIDSVGRVGIGTGTTTGYQLRLAGTYADPSATVIVTGINGTLPSTNTSNAYGVFSGLSTTAASYTLSKLHHFFASQGTIGAGSAITDQYGFHANSTLTGATNNYGFYSNIAAGTGRWNFYANGTADNYFAGNVQFAAGTAAAPAITTSGDTNTGIFFPAADTIAVSTGGTERLRFDSAGDINMAATSSLQKNSINAYALKNITYLTSGTAATYTTPTGVRALKVTVIGAGGGGGGVDGLATANTNAYSDGGGGGGYAIAFIATAEASYTYTVGAGGTGGAAGNNAGAAGGTTEFKNAGATVVISSTGGAGGLGDTGATSTGASTGAPGVGSITGLGTPGGVVGSGTGQEANGYGRFINGTIYSLSGGAYCPFIGGGVPTTAQATGANATNYGEGGGAVRTTTASASNFAGGNGFAGLIIVEEYY